MALIQFFTGEDKQVSCRKQEADLKSGPNPSKDLLNRITGYNR